MTQIKAADYSICECSAYKLGDVVIHLSWCAKKKKAEKQTRCCDLNCADQDTHRAVHGISSRN